MIFKNMIDLNVQDSDCVVKIGDTIEDIREGLNAKVWTIGVVIGSSELGLSETEVNEISETELNVQIAIVRHKMTEAGAHFVINTMAELPGIIEYINSKSCVQTKRQI